MPREPKPNREQIRTPEDAERYAIQYTAAESRKVRKRPDSAVSAPGDNDKYLSHNLRLARLQGLTLRDPAETIRDRVFEYFQICSEDGMRPTAGGLAIALGIDYRRLWEVKAGKSSCSSEVKDIISQAYMMINAQVEAMMYDGKAPAIPCIFMLKNHAGFTDSQQIELSAAKNDDAERSVEELEQKYMDAVPADFSEYGEG